MARQTVYLNTETRVAIDREAKVRIGHLGRALKRRTEKGKQYGVLTGKYVDVLDTMLWKIHDKKSGQCNPSIATIADKAGCAPSTVERAITALEKVKILSWVHRIRRVRENGVWTVVRTSNAYVFHDPKAAPIPVEARRIPRNTESQSGPPDEKIKPMPPELAAALASYLVEMEERDRRRKGLSNGGSQDLCHKRRSHAG